MRSPTYIVQRILEYLETSFIPYRPIWWRVWTPPMEKDVRYQDGYFAGYGEPEEGMPWVDIRRAVRNRFVRKIYKALPYVDVRPIERQWDAMTEEERTLRECFASGATKAVYSHGKALYARETIRDVEDQLKAYELTQRPTPKLLARCEAPQTAFVHYRDFDGVVQYQGTWKPGASMELGNIPVKFGRSQIEFRTIQELVIPDPDNAREVYAPDQWEPSIAYNTLSVCSRIVKEGMVDMYGEPEEQLGAKEMGDCLDVHRKKLDESPEWAAISAVVAASKALRCIDKIVFFYATGFSDDCDHCKRALYLLGVATRLRDLLLVSRDGTEGKTSGVIPIYMPSFSINRIWSDSENEVLRAAGVIPIDSNGELVLKIDDKTAVISYRHWNPVKQIVADIARPALLICKPVAEDTRDFLYRVEDRDGKEVKIPLIRARDIDNSIVARDPDSPRVREMMKNYDEHRLPTLPGETYAEEPMSCYVRKPHTPLAPDYYR